MSSDTVTTGASDELKKKALIKLTEQDKEIEQDAATHFVTDSFPRDRLRLSTLGMCFISSTIPEAETVKLKALGDKFKYLEGDEKNEIYLTTALVECTNKGEEAFEIAKGSMEAINEGAKNIADVLREIIKMIGNKTDMQDSMPSRISDLQSFVQDCATAGHEMDAAFNDWQNLTLEVYTCMTRASSDASELLGVNQIALAVANTQLTTVNVQTKTAQDTLGQVKTAVDSAKTAFEKASNEFPHGWEAVAQHCVSALVDGYAVGLKAALPALAANITPEGDAKTAMNVFDNMMSDRSKKNNPSHQIEANPENSPKKPPKKHPEDHDDPAYAAIPNVLQHVGILQSVLTGGKSHGIDWDHVVRKEDDQDVKTGLGYALGILQYYKEDFKGTKKPPSQVLNEILNDCIETAEAVKKIGAEDMDEKDRPGPDDEDVKKWQSTVVGTYKKGSKLAATAKSGAGSGGHHVPRIKDYNSTFPPEPQGAHGDSMLQEASHRLEITQTAYDAANKNYQVASDRLVEIQGKLGQIQGEITKLNVENTSLQATKSILRKCMAIIIEMKAEISKLLQFFHAVDFMIEHAVKREFGPLIKSLDNAEQNSAKVANYKYTTLQCQLMYTHMLMLGGYCSVFEDVAALYLKVHEKFIRPGIDLVRELSLEDDSSDKSARGKKLQALHEYSTNHQQEIVKILKDGKSHIAGHLQDQVSKSSQMLGDFPIQQPTEVTDAVEEGKKIVTDAAKHGIDEEPKPVTKDRWARGDDGDLL